MEFGVTIFPTDATISLVELGPLVEARGFESLFVPEHTHIPLASRGPRPGGELPPEYPRFLDPFVGLAAVAAVTSRLRLGTGVCLVAQHDPITLAKRVASLDFVSNGRFLFGIGGGWNEAEMKNHGTKPSLRWKILRERILAMQAIWTQDEAEYHGPFVDFGPIWSWPKPVQRPYPPILVGGEGPRTLQRVIEYGDGWLPRGRREIAQIVAMIAELNRLAVEAGRGPVPVSVFGVPPDRDVIERYRAVGVARCIFRLPSARADEVLPVLDRYAEVVQRLLSGPVSRQETA